MKKNFYQILQVDPNADSEIIEVAYKRLARKYHPDVNNSPNATSQMQEINEAYETLKNEFKRKQYNAEFLPNLKQSKTTNTQTKNTKTQQKAKEANKKTEATSQANNYYTSAKVEQEEAVKADKVRYSEWAKKSTTNWKNPKQSSPPNSNKSSIQDKKSKISKNIKEIAISIIVFNSLPFLYLFYAFDKQITVVNTSSDAKTVENAWFNISVICLSAVLSIVSIYGGFRMYKLKNYRLAIFSTITLFFTSIICCVLSYLFAIGGLIILLDSEAKALFEKPNVK